MFFQRDNPRRGMQSSATAPPADRVEPEREWRRNNESNDPNVLKCMEELLVENHEDDETAIVTPSRRAPRTGLPFRFVRWRGRRTGSPGSDNVPGSQSSEELA